MSKDTIGHVLFSALTSGYNAQNDSGIWAIIID